MSSPYSFKISIFINNILFLHKYKVASRKWKPHTNILLGLIAMIIYKVNVYLVI